MTKFKITLQYIFLSIVSFMAVFPLVWMGISATNRSIDVTGGRLLPGTYFFTNLNNLIDLQPVGSSFMNSLVYALIVTALALLVSSAAGYGFEVYHDRAKDIILGIILLSMMIPFAAVMVPLFRMFSNAGFVDTIIGYVLPSIATPFLILLFRQGARSFPKEIIDAARVDGMKEMGIFFFMFMPTMKSIYGTAAVITFMGAWNSYMWPRIILWDESSITMPMMLSRLTQGYVIDFGMVMLGVFISTIPMIIFFFIMQKSFTEGITGSSK